MRGTIIPERCKQVCSERDSPLPEGAGYASLEVLLDPNFSLVPQMDATARNAFYQFQLICQLCPFPEGNDVKTVMCVLVTSRLDNGNGLLCGAASIFKSGNFSRYRDQQPGRSLGRNTEAILCLGFKAPRRLPVWF